MDIDHPLNITNKEARVWAAIAEVRSRLQTLENGTPLPTTTEVPGSDAGAEGRITIRSGGNVSPSLLVKVDGVWRELVFTTPR